MFIGHFGVGFGAKAAAPRTSLGLLFIAAQFVDLLWPTLLLLGLEHVKIVPGVTRVTPLDFVDYPISHSLLAVVAWSVLFAGVYYIVGKYRAGAWVCGLAVLSHWVLDLVVHRPDLPLAPGSSARFGLGVWNSLPATMAVELAIFGLGVYLYWRTTKAVDRTGSLAFWGLVVFLLLVFASNLLGPPPPSETAIAWVGQAQWLLVLWAFWVDHYRVTAGRPSDD